MILDFKVLDRAISTAKETLRFLTAGMPIIKRSPKGGVHVDVPVMFMDFAIDRIHYDPQLGVSPKGRPVRIYSKINPQKIIETIDKILREAYVVEAVEFREPDNAWIIPVAWKKLIIMHIKVSESGEEIIPDYGLTNEVRRTVD